MGYGAAAGVIQAMRRDYLRAERRAAERRAMQEAARAAARRVRHKVSAEQFNEPTLDDRRAFPCAFACAECHTLTWPQGADPSMHSPMRRNAVATSVPTHACLRCGESAWVDLAIPRNGAMILDTIEAGWLGRRSRFRVLLGVLIAALGSLSITAWQAQVLPVAGPTAPAHIMLVVPTAMLFFALAMLGVRRKSVRSMSSRRLAPVDRAPVSNRVCSGYAVEVYRAGSTAPCLTECGGNTAIGEWRDHVVERDNATLARWLAERGIDIEAGGLVIRERVAA